MRPFWCSITVTLTLITWPIIFYRHFVVQKYLLHWAPCVRNRRIRLFSAIFRAIAVVVLRVVCVRLIFNTMASIRPFVSAWPTIFWTWPIPPSFAPMKNLAMAHTFAQWIIPLWLTAVADPRAQVLFVCRPKNYCVPCHLRLIMVMASGMFPLLMMWLSPISKATIKPKIMLLQRLPQRVVLNTIQPAMVGNPTKHPPKRTRLLELWRLMMGATQRQIRLVSWQKGAVFLAETTLYVWLTMTTTPVSALMRTVMEIGILTKPTVRQRVRQVAIKIFGRVLWARVPEFKYLGLIKILILMSMCYLSKKTAALHPSVFQPLQRPRLAVLPIRAQSIWAWRVEMWLLTVGLGQDQRLFPTILLLPQI